MGSGRHRLAQLYQRSRKSFPGSGGLDVDVLEGEAQTIGAHRLEVAVGIPQILDGARLAASPCGRLSREQNGAADVPKVN
jgi:hypothetical protein